MEMKVRTTLDIDADVLAATKEIAKRQRKSAGKLASELMREAATPRRAFFAQGEWPAWFSADPLWRGARQRRTRQPNAR